MSASVTSNVRDRLERVDFPLEYHAELLGDYSDQQDAQRRLLGFAIAAAIGIFLLLQAAFGSWRLAIITFVIAAGRAGRRRAVAAWIDGGPMTLATVAGLLAVLALAAAQRRHAARPLSRACGHDDGVAFRSRARSPRRPASPWARSVMTAVTTAIVLLPVIVFGDIAGQELDRSRWPVVIVGGLVTSTLVSLFVLPALYLRFGPPQEPEPLDSGPS